MKRKTWLLALALSLPAASVAAYSGGSEARTMHRSACAKMNLDEDRSEKNDRVIRQIERRQARKQKAELWVSE